ncbi:hypothetical protein HK101_005324 [Irineochytrium annulatum]|nr:hypothetical protein HK101_005324 [Irineochytrium annulatum]
MAESKDVCDLATRNWDQSDAVYISPAAQRTTYNVLQKRSESIEAGVDMHTFSDDVDNVFDTRTENDRKAQEGVDYSEVLESKDRSPPISCDGDKDLAFGVDESLLEKMEQVSTLRERVSAEHPDTHLSAEMSFHDFFTVPDENAALAYAIRLEDDGPPDASMSFGEISESLADGALPPSPMLPDTSIDTSGTKEMDGHQDILEYTEIAPSADPANACINDADGLTQNYRDCEVEHNVEDGAGNYFSTELMNGGEVVLTKDTLDKFVESNPYDILALDACGVEKGVDSADVAFDTGGNGSEAGNQAKSKEGKADEQVGADTSNTQGDVAVHPKLKLANLPESVEGDLSESDAHTTGVGMSTTAVNVDLDENSVLLDIAELEASSFSIDAGMSASAFRYGMSDAIRHENRVQTSSMASYAVTPTFDCSAISPDRGEEHPEEAGDVLSGLTGDLTDAGVGAAISNGASSIFVKSGDTGWRDCDVSSIQGANVGDHSVVEGSRDEGKQRMGSDVTGIWEKTNVGEDDINEESPQAGPSASVTSGTISLGVDAQALASAEKLQRRLISIGGEQDVDIYAELKLLLVDWKLALISSNLDVEDDRVLDERMSALDRKIGIVTENIESNAREIAKLKLIIADSEESWERLRKQADDLSAKDAELAIEVNQILEGGVPLRADTHPAAKATVLPLVATLQRFAPARARGAATNAASALVGVAMIGITVYASVLVMQWMEDRRLYGIWLGLDDEDPELRKPFSVYVEVLLHYFGGSSEYKALI